MPLLDHPLVEFVASDPEPPQDEGFHQEVPAARGDARTGCRATRRRVRSRASTCPIPIWLVGPLRERVHDVLAPARIAARRLLPAGAVRSAIRDHEERRRDFSRDIWTLLMFQTWYDRIAQGVQGSEPVHRLVG